MRYVGNAWFEISFYDVVTQYYCNKKSFYPRKIICCKCKYNDYDARCQGQFYCFAWYLIKIYCFWLEIIYDIIKTLSYYFVYKYAQYFVSFLYSTKFTVLWYERIQTTYIHTYYQLYINLKKSWVRKKSVSLHVTLTSMQCNI